MTTVYRVTALWGGFTGAPGYSRFSFQNLVDDTSRNAAGANLKTFFDSLISYLQSGWTVTVQPNIDEFDMATGLLTGGSSMTTVPGPTTGTVSNTLAYAGGAGACITWNTGLIFAGRRVRGRTFLVPLISAFGADGTLATPFVTSVQAAGNALCTAASADLSVWSRQYNTAQPPVQIGGALASASTAVVKDVTSQLRSRRL